MKAIEAGADIVDTSVSSMALGPGHNPTEALIEMLEGTGFTTRVDIDKVYQAKAHFAKIRPRYAEFLTDFTGVETEIFKSQIPGGMLSNMEGQLKQQGQGDKMKEVLEEVPRVRADAGFPPLVTPSSQIVGTQAVFNVMMGKYKTMTGEFQDLMLGYYGKTDAEKNPDVVEKAKEFSKKEEITCRPADLLNPEWETLQEKAGALDGFNGSDEDVLTYAMFPGVAPKFFAERSKGPLNLGKDPNVVTGPVDASHPGYLAAPIDYEVTVNGKTTKVTVAPA
jgi:methylmalonyl-CoA carboxyltransferase 5S subunit